MCLCRTQEDETFWTEWQQIVCNFLYCHVLPNRSLHWFPTVPKGFELESHVVSRRQLERKTALNCHQLPHTVQNVRFHCPGDLFRVSLSLSLPLFLSFSTSVIQRLELKIKHIIQETEIIIAGRKQQSNMPEESFWEFTSCALNPRLWTLDKPPVSQFRIWQRSDLWAKISAAYPHHHVKQMRIWTR